MLIVYRADLPRTLALAVGLPLAAPATSVVVREFHSSNPRITTTANLDRKPSAAALSDICRTCRRELPISKPIDRIRKVE